MKLKAYCRHQDVTGSAHPQSRSSSSVCKDGHAMVAAAVKKSVERAEDTADAWAVAYRACKRDDATLIDAICRRDTTSRSLLQTVVQQGDSNSVRLLHACLPNGSYADGDVIRTADTLHTAINADGAMYGYLKHRHDNPYVGYVGSFKDGIKQGWGRFDYAPDHFYEGHWENNHHHGVGKLTYSYKKKPITYEAIFDQGEILELITKTEPVARFNLFRIVKDRLSRN